MQEISNLIQDSACNCCVLLPQVLLAKKSCLRLVFFGLQGENEDLLLISATQDNVEVNPFTQASIAKPELENTNCSFHQKGAHGPMCRPRKLGTRTQHCSLLTECSVSQRKFLASIMAYTFISHTKISIFFSYLFVKKYLLVGALGMLWTGQWVSE